MSELAAAIQHALKCFDSEIRQKDYQRAICKGDGQDIYVSNLTAQIAQLEGFKTALAAQQDSRTIDNTPSCGMENDYRRASSPDLIDRLRDYGAKFSQIDPEYLMCIEAAAEIERLRAALAAQQDGARKKPDIDPAEIWEDYVAEVPALRRSPQGALAFGVDAALRRHEQHPPRSDSAT